MSKVLRFNGQVATVFSEIGEWLVGEEKTVEDALAEKLLRSPLIDEVKATVDKVAKATVKKADAAPVVAEAAPTEEKPSAEA